MHFVNLRDEPYSIAEIPEADRYPDLARALRALNANRSPFLTAKCDAWPISPRDGATELEPCARNSCSMKTKPPTPSPATSISSGASAPSLPPRTSSRTASTASRAAPPSCRMSESMLQCVLRPAMVDLDTPLEGFATTLYVTALGSDPEIANRRWASALEDVVDLLRTREFEVNRTSATIDA